MQNDIFDGNMLLYDLLSYFEQVPQKEGEKQLRKPAKKITIEKK